MIMKYVFFFYIGLMGIVLLGCESAPDLLIDNFEGALNSQTVDFGASEGSALRVTASEEFKVCDSQSMKIEYTLKTSGYMWVARGFNLDVEGAGQWLVKPEEIPWRRYNAIRLSMYGRDSPGVVAFDIKDSGGEMWRFLLDDDFQGWKEIVCPFSQFFVRGDWQPDTADNNEVLDFPIMSFQFEPRLPGSGVYYFDCIALTNVKDK
jgi:hypothetical protein